MRRHVAPELLDRLPPDDPRAIHSRRDLRRINKIMGNAGIMVRALRTVGRMPFSIVELGGGDGTFLLELARRAASSLGEARGVLVDRQSLMTPATRGALKNLGWDIQPVQDDVFEWLNARGTERADVTIANLFLHHFEGERLATLLRQAARQTLMFVACEPHRSGAALAAASMMRLIGCNGVTVHDGRISVRAGFRDHELSAIWPSGAGWTVDERREGPFTQGFVARHDVAHD